MARSLLTGCAALIVAATVAAADIPDVACVGDCDTDHTVTVAEAIRLVNIALGNEQGTCPQGMPTSGVNVSVIVQAVLHAVGGCPELGAGDCCQCAGFCAAPLDGSCGGCAIYFAASCNGSSCARATPTATALSADTPIPTATPGASDCCACATSCAAPTDGSCGACTVVFHAACGGGMLCVRHTATPTP